MSLIVNRVTNLPYGRPFKPDQGKTLSQQVSLAKGSHGDEFKSRSVVARMTREALPVSFALRYMGLSKWRSTRSIGRPGSLRTRDEQSQYEVYEYLWNLSVFGRTLHWCQTRSFGVLTPSLSVYPLVEDFSETVYDLLFTGTIEDFQRHLISGALHPFTRNSSGSSLLHVGYHISVLLH